MNTTGNIVSKLSAIIEKEPIDWDAFDSVLIGAENINAYDEKYEETLLSEFIMEGNFYNRGFILADVVRHFLACGYDVSANDGLNGGLALHSLCWSSYDHYILEAAKILMNAGAPVKYRTSDDDPNEEPEGLLGSISWKLSGAWMVDKNYTWANILEAYYAMTEANIAGKAYNSIDSYLACIGKPLSSVSAIKSEDKLSLQNDGVLSVYSEPIVMWFGDKPLAISCYTDFVVNPVYADDNKNELCDVTSAFSSVVGATLKDVQYIGTTICYFEFDNGRRIFFASRDIGNRKRVGTFEIRAIGEAVNIEHLKIESICGINGTAFASTVTNYEENAIALFCGDEAYLLYLCIGSDNKYKLGVCSCSKELLKEYSRQYPLKNHSQISCFYKKDNLKAIRIDYPDGHFYMMATEYDMELQLNDRLYDPLANSVLPRMEGIHMEFGKRNDSLND